MTITAEQFKSLSQRLRYEAFSKFAMEIGKLNRYEDINDTLTYSLKYMVSFKFARIVIQHQDVSLNYILAKGKGNFHKDPLCSFEKSILKKGISVEYDKVEVSSQIEPLRCLAEDETARKVFFFPMRISESQNLLVELVHPQNQIYSEIDIPLLRLIGEFLLAKVSQIYLSQELEDKNEILARKNFELHRLNEEVSALNASLETKVKERTKELASANEELKTVFYRSSHDLKSPLTTLKGLMSLITNVTSHDKEVQLLIEKSSQTIDKMGKMFDKMSLISSVYQHFKTSEKIDLGSLISELLDKYQHTIKKENITVSCGNNPGLSTYFEKDLLLAVMEVLLENAIQFQKTRYDQRCIEISFGRFQREDFIDIVDNGIGIASEVFPRIFEMYYRGSLQSKGNGLGLYVAEKLTGLINGRIICCSENGSGTQFRVYIPR